MILGSSTTNLYYSALAGNELVFVRKDDGRPLVLASAILTMP
jgi:hypothetical protein